MKYNALTLIYHMHRQEKPIFPLSGQLATRRGICLAAWLVRSCLVMPTQRLRYENGNGNENGNLVVSEQRRQWENGSAAVELTFRCRRSN